jgi:capsular polysaccharide biosynthesis protein
MLAVLAAVILYLAFPLQYEASAVLHIRSAKPQFLFDVPPSGRYDNFVNTQLALMRSPIILNKALEDPEVAKLPCIVKQKDRRGWLAKKLRAKPEGKSELVMVSIGTENADASEIIVNAIVETYLRFIEDTARDTDNKIVMNLQVEGRRLTQLAQQLQGNIRSESKKISEQVAGDADCSEAEAILGFDRTQLARVNKTLDMIEGRILVIQTEMRAPGQISHLSTASHSLPCRAKQLTLMAIGAATAFFVTLLLGWVATGRNQRCSRYTENG